MSFTLFSRRTFMTATVALLAVLPAAHALAAPFASERITVRTEGAGPDVVLVPGLNSSPRAWASTVAALPGYRYHLVQLSGFAGQPAGANGEGLVAAPAAEEIARYIREAKLQQPAVIGHSMGGTIGLMLASRHPESLSRLMVVDMFPYLGTFFAGPGAPPERVAIIADGVAAHLRSAPPEQRSKRADDTIAGMVDTESMRAGATADVLASDADVGSRAMRELIVTNLIPELPKIAVPVTVLYVQPKSVPLPAEQFDAVYRSGYAPVKQLTLKRIPDSAHFIMWDQPQRFQGEVKTFLEAGVAPAAAPSTSGTGSAQARNCRNTRPAYPERAQRQEMEGVVKAAVLIAADGSYLKGKIRKSSGWRLLDDATLAAAAGWCWKPTYENGVPVEAWQEFDYTWSLG
ncbi:alpha/beta fold hydrolase [Telluria sp. B2]